MNDGAPGVVLPASLGRDDAALSARAFRLNVIAWAFAAEELTDGRVPWAALRRLLAEAGASRREVRELVETGRWGEASDGGFVLTEWLSWNRSRASWERQRQLTLERVTRFRSPVRIRAPSPVEKRDFATAPAEPANDAQRVNEPPAERPFARFDDDDIDVIATVDEGGFDPLEALAYERQHQRRAEVLAGLERLLSTRA